MVYHNNNIPMIVMHHAITLKKTLISKMSANCPPNYPGLGAAAGGAEYVQATGLGAAAGGAEHVQATGLDAAAGGAEHVQATDPAWPHPSTDVLQVILLSREIPEKNIQLLLFGYEPWTNWDLDT